MKREEFLRQAESLVNGERAKDYGEAYDNHDRIAEGWNIILRSALISHGEITPTNVAVMMDWLKTSRILNKIDHSDSWVDKAAYSSLGGEFSSKDAPDAKV